MSTAQVDSPLRANPVFWLMWLLPAAAVVAGLATLGIALRHGDRELPPAYHWEGERLDQDFARARLAAAHGIGLSLDMPAAPGECVASLRHAPGDPAALTLLFTNGVDPGLDRVVMLRRAARGEYRGSCAPLPAGRWRVALEDDAGAWAIRTQVAGDIRRLELRAHSPDGA